MVQHVMRRHESMDEWIDAWDETIPPKAG